MVNATLILPVVVLAFLTYKLIARKEDYGVR